MSNHCKLIYNIFCLNYQNSKYYRSLIDLIFVANFDNDSLICRCKFSPEFSTSKEYASTCIYANTCVNVCMFSMHVYISGSGTFVLLRYIYVQAFGYCRFLKKLENTLHSRSQLPFLNFSELLCLMHVHSDRITLRENQHPSSKYLSPSFTLMCSRRIMLSAIVVPRYASLINEMNSPKRP